MSMNYAPTASTARWFRTAVSKHGADRIQELIRELRNCRAAQVDEAGWVWISGPQAGHWDHDPEQLRERVEDLLASGVD